MRIRAILIGSLVAVWAMALVSAPCAAVLQFKDIATDGSDPGNLSDTEPSIAVNPLNPNDIVIVTFSEGWTPGASAPVWRSLDGGFSWKKSPILPQPAPGSSAPADQKVDFDANGNLSVAELASGLPVPDSFVFRQTGAAGANLTPGAVYGNDQPHLAVGRSTAKCLGQVYSPWLDVKPSPDNDLSMVALSANSGVTINDIAVGLNAQFSNRTTRIALAPDGAAYVIFKLRQGAVAVSLPGSPTNDFENAQFVVRRSDDCGQTWQPMVLVHSASTVQTLFTVNFGDRSRGKVARARSSDAWIATDPRTGDVYAAYVQRDASGFSQVYVSRSTDRGATWTSNRVTDGTHHSAYPEIAVAANGAIGVLYIDFDNAGPSTVFRHRFARSFDGGLTWTDQVLQAMDPGPIVNAATGFLWGDYEGLTAQGNLFLGVFTGQSIGRTVLQLDPIFFTESAIQPTKELCLEDCRTFFDYCMTWNDPLICDLVFSNCQYSCQQIPIPQQNPQLTVKKILIPSTDGGRFNLLVDGAVMARAAGDSGSTGPVVVSTGVHTVSEAAENNNLFAAYTTTIGGDCAPDGSVTLTAGEIKTCTITNVRRQLTPHEFCVAQCRLRLQFCHDGMCWMEFERCLKACPP